MSTSSFNRFPWLLCGSLLLLWALACALELLWRPRSTFGYLAALETLFLGLAFAGLLSVLLRGQADNRQQTEQLKLQYQALERQRAELLSARRDLKQLAEAHSKTEALLQQQAAHIHHASLLNSISVRLDGFRQQIRELEHTEEQLLAQTGSVDSEIMRLRYDLSKARTLNYASRAAREQSVVPMEQRLAELEQGKTERADQLETLRIRTSALYEQRDHYLACLEKAVTPELDRLANSHTLPAEVTSR